MGLTTGGGFRFLQPANVVFNSIPTASANITVGQYTANNNSTFYISAQPVGFTISGLKPMTRISIFFDKINVTQYCAPASYDMTLKTLRVSDYYISGPQGSAIITDVTGTARGVFYVPQNMFQVGSREFHVFDYLTSGDVYTERLQNFSCQAFVYFQTMTQSGVNATQPSVVSTIPTQTQSDTTLSNRSSGTPTSSDPSTPRSDPLCQSFFVGSDMTGGEDGIHLKAVDLYFATKHFSQPITIDIRTVENDSPTTTVLPYSSVTLQSSNVVADSTGTTPTTFTFDTPIYLRAGYSYAIGVNPGGQVPDYTVWSGVVGKADVNSKSIVNANWGQGTLFTSTSGTSWTPVQNEFLKFTMYRTGYLSSGTASFVNKDYEFLTYSNTSLNQFIPGEYVYQMIQPFGGFVSVNTTSNVITYNTAASVLQTYNLTTDFSVGDPILIIGSGAIATANNNLNVGLFANAIAATVTSTNVTAGTLQFAYTNGAATTGAPWVNSAAAFFKPAKGLVSISANSTTVSGVGTQFSAQFNTNANGANKVPMVVQWSNSTSYGREVLWPNNIINATSMTVRNAPFTTNAVAIPLTTPVGKVVSVDQTRRLIVLDRSTANGTSSNTAWQNVFSSPSYFAQSRVIVGTQSYATALIDQIVDISMNSLQPVVSATSIQGTSLSFSANTTTSTYTDVDYPTISTSATKYFTNNELIVASRTNEINRFGGNKSLTLTANLVASNTRFNSPVLDFENMNALAGSYALSATASNEYTNYGTALAKSVSKPVILGDGNDAEDLQVYLTAYKPLGTEIKVYAKLLSASDTESFDSKYWTPLLQTSDVKVYSDPTNTNDYKEFTYTIPTDPIQLRNLSLITINGSPTFTSTTGNVNYSNFGNNPGPVLFLVASDASPIPSNYQIVQFANLVNNTTISVTANITLANTTSATLSSLLYPYTAFKNSLNQNIVTYYNTDGSAHTTFKQYAIKIVMLSSNNALVPKIRDSRVIALSV